MSVVHIAFTWDASWSRFVPTDYWTDGGNWTSGQYEGSMTYRSSATFSDNTSRSPYIDLRSGTSGTTRPSVSQYFIYGYRDKLSSSNIYAEDGETWLVDGEVTGKFAAIPIAWVDPVVHATDAPDGSDNHSIIIDIDEDGTIRTGSTTIGTDQYIDVEHYIWLTIYVPYDSTLSTVIARQTSSSGSSLASTTSITVFGGPSYALSVSGDWAEAYETSHDGIYAENHTETYPGYENIEDSSTTIAPAKAAYPISFVVAIHVGPESSTGANPPNLRLHALRGGRDALPPSSTTWSSLRPDGTDANDVALTRPRGAVEWVIDTALAAARYVHSSVYPTDLDNLTTSPQAVDCLPAGDKDPGSYRCAYRAATDVGSSGVAKGHQILTVDGVPGSVDLTTTDPVVPRLLIGPLGEVYMGALAGGQWQEWAAQDGREMALQFTESTSMFAGIWPVAWIELSDRTQVIAGLECTASCLLRRYKDLPAYSAAVIRVFTRSGFGVEWDGPFLNRTMSTEWSAELTAAIAATTDWTDSANAYAPSITGPYLVEQSAGGVELGLFSTIKLKSTAAVYHCVQVYSAPDFAEDWTVAQCTNYST